MRTMDESTTNAIEVRNLVKGYKGVPVLHDVSFTVRRGTVFALLGANGSGKTTTINILTTSIKADGGTASVAGFDVAEQPSKVREQISVTGQFAAVDDVLTARENLVLMGELRHVADPGQTAGGPAGQVRTERGCRPPPADLLGRERRRIDIAMSLVGDSPIFFDEPTTGLDLKGRTDMWLTIRQLVENGTTVFLTTQYLEEADRLADEIAILHGGRIVASTPDELKAMAPTGLVELEFGEEAQLSAAQSARRAARGRPGGLETGGRHHRPGGRDGGHVHPAQTVDRADRVLPAAPDAGRRVLQVPRRRGGGSTCERSLTPGP